MTETLAFLSFAFSRELFYYMIEIWTFFSEKKNKNKCSATEGVQVIASFTIPLDKSFRKCIADFVQFLVSRAPLSHQLTPLVTIKI